VITNLNNPLEKNRIFQKLAQRTNVGWSISFDNIGQRFEYVRHGADWQLQLHNLDLIQELKQSHGHGGGIHAVYNLYNATRLVEFKQFAQDRAMTIKWQHLGGPKSLNPRQYGCEIAKLATDEIERMFEQFETDLEEKNYFGDALQYYKQQHDENPTALAELKQFVTQIEQVYHPDKAGKFAELWPEIGALL
jgi:hypothetical protein